MPLERLIAKGAWLGICLLPLIVLVNTAWCQTQVIAPADTTSPRATLQSFIDACNQVYGVVKESRFLDDRSSTHRPLVAKVLDCLNTSEVPAFEGRQYAGEAAICLKEILDRVELPPWDQIPDLDSEASWQIPGTRITIARVEEGPRRHEYLFSPGTVRRAPEYYEDIKALPYRTTGPATSPGFYKWYVSAPGNRFMGAIVDRLPAWMRSRVGNVPLWRWVGLALATVLAIGVMALLYRVHRALTNRFKDTAPILHGLTIVFPVMAALVPIMLRDFTFRYLTLTGEPLYVVSFITNLTSLLVSLGVIFGIGNRVAAMIIAAPQINPQGLDAQFIRIVSKLLSIIGAAILFLEGGQRLGIPINTLLASAGVGGLALALSAQDMVKSLFGTIMLLMDKPFRVGERIVFGKYDGVVEDIGLRSTRIRLLTGHQATIPNDELAKADIENVGRRPCIRRSMTLEMPSRTPVTKVKRALEIVREILKDHEGMAPELPPRVYLRDFKESSIGMLVMYWYHPPEYWEFLAFSERVNLEIIERLEAEQIPFAIPAVTVQMSGETHEGPKQT
ncbi:MAG: mechanosensitive ion channel family protein [Planctomycetota bacterium]